MDLDNIGPFDSNSAADFLSDLYSAEADKRVPLIESALRTGADPDDGFLDSHEALPAIAAAAIVHYLYEGDDRKVPEAIAMLGVRDLAPVPDDLVPLAVRALDRVLAADSELNEHWAATDHHASWTAAIRTLRKGLADR